MGGTDKLDEEIKEDKHSSIIVGEPIASMIPSLPLIRMIH